MNADVYPTIYWRPWFAYAFLVLICVLSVWVWSPSKKTIDEQRTDYHESAVIIQGLADQESDPIRKRAFTQAANSIDK